MNTTRPSSSLSTGGVALPLQFQCLKSLRAQFASFRNCTPFQPFGDVLCCALETLPQPANCQPCCPVPEPNRNYCLVSAHLCMRCCILVTCGCAGLTVTKSEGWSRVRGTAPQCCMVARVKIHVTARSQTSKLANTRSGVHRI